MKKTVFLSLTALIFFTGIIIPAWAGQTRMSDPRKPIHVESGSIFIVTLESNRTTGYEWQVAGKLDPSAFEIVGVEYVKGASPLVGSGGIENWTFRALSAKRAPCPALV